MTRYFRRQGATLAEIEAVYRGRFSEFVRVASSILGDREAGRDAVQDAFALAVRKRGLYTRQGSLSGWLWRIVVNQALSERRGRPCITYALPESGEVPSASADIDEFRALIASLPERQRAVVFLRYFADLDYAQIAKILELSPGTVGATLNAARAAVRRALVNEPA